MNSECRKIRDELLDMVYADAGSATGSIADNATTSATVPSMGDIAKHLADCSGCRDYAGGLADIAASLPAPQGVCDAVGAVGIGNAGEWADANVLAAGASPDWARLSSTIERGMEIRAAREHRAVGLFALTAAGILAAVWGPLLARSPQALLTLQAVGFSGIALFYLPIHMLRGRRGDDI